MSVRPHSTAAAPAWSKRTTRRGRSRIGEDLKVLRVSRPRPRRRRRCRPCSRLDRVLGDAVHHGRLGSRAASRIVGTMSMTWWKLRADLSAAWMPFGQDTTLRCVCREVASHLLAPLERRVHRPRPAHGYRLTTSRCRNRQAALDVVQGLMALTDDVHVVEGADQ